MSEVNYIQGKEDAKILFLSNAVYAPSGYGVQANGMLYDWIKNGYKVRQLAHYGLHGRMIGLNGLMIYPALEGDLHGDKTARLIFQNWKPDIFFTLYDIWMDAYIDGNPEIPETMRAIHPYWIPICVSGDTEIQGDTNRVLGSNGLTEVLGTQSLPPLQPVYKIKTENGRILKITADNPIWTKRGWVQANELKYTDMVSTYIGKPYESMGISSWNDRWGWNNHHKVIQKSFEGKQVTFNAKDNDNKLLNGFDGSLKSDALCELSRNEPKPKTQKSSFKGEDVSNSNRWTQGMSKVTRKDNSLVDCEKATGLSFDEFYKMENQRKERIQSTKRSKGCRVHVGDQEDELSTWERVVGKRIVTRAVKRVYDITTRTHNFFANGILIHNCMVDHEPVPEKTVLNARCAYKVVTPTKYGKQQLEAQGVPTQYIPFGIDSTVWRPCKDEDEKKVDKKALNERSVPFNPQRRATIEEDSFLIHINGANKDPYRKAFMRAFIALQLFFQNNPDAERDTRVYVHSWMRFARDLPHGARTLQVDWACKGCSDYHMLCGVPDDAMAQIARTADVFLHPTQGGGFEIPIMEALSCGVPVIASDFVGIPELVGNAGWLIPPKTKYFSPLDATQAIADEYKMCDAIEKAYNMSPKARRRMGMKGRKHVLEEYQWVDVNRQYRELIENTINEMRYKPLKERQI